MDQTLVNWILAAASALIGALLNAMWQAVKDLQKSDMALADKVSEVEILVAGSYVKRDELSAMTNALFAKLDRIEEKLDKKVDK